MQSTQKPPVYKRRFFTTPRVLCILGFVFAYLSGLTTFVPQASAATLSAPGGNVSSVVVRQMDIARPAVVRIVTIINGQLTVRFTASVSATFPQGGASYPLEMTGSGAFISAHGEILTADHVVNPPHGQELDTFLYQEAAQDVADYINAHFQVTTPYSANDAYNLLLSGSIPSTTSYGPPSSEVYLSTSYAGAINAAKLETVPAADKALVDRIEAQSSFSQNDVAIIHVSGMDNMPSIQLGDSSKVAELDNLTIIGYPGLADLSNAPTNFLTSSINTVYVSALKITDTGAPVIQVGGNVEHGDSGGPALDDNGNIVGIVSFGYSGTNGDYGETSFLQASNSALSLIKTQGINTTPGAFESAWARAVDDYSSSAAGHWHQAAQELQSLKRSYPGFVGVAPFLTYAQTQASREPVSASSSGASSTSLLLIVLLIVLLLLALGVGFYVLFRRNGRTVVVTPGGAHYQSGAYGAYQQPSGVYPQAPVPAAYPASAAYSQPMPGAVPGTPQPLSSGIVYPAYTSPAAYGAQPGQVPQTPQPVMSAHPQAAFARNGAFSLPPVQTPQPVVNEVVPHPLSTWNSPVQESNPAQPVQAPSAQSEDGTLSDVLEKSATYALSADQAEVLSARTLAESPANTPLPSDDAWPARASEDANGAAERAPLTADDAFVSEGTTSGEEEKTTLAQSSARTFSVPRRPISSETATSVAPEAASGTSVASPYTWVAPCGHTNTPDVRFCRVCGQPVASTVPETGTHDGL